MLDFFVVETGRVTKLDNKKTSFEKQWLSGQWSITGSTNALHVSEPYIANPGFVFIENIVEISTGTTIDST